ncbi:MAG: hypothetical protein NVS2B9_09270 [Myxococcales bacterium]
MLRSLAAACLAALIFTASPARAELKERVAAVVNGQPIALSEVLDRLQVELQRINAQPEGPARDRERTEMIKRGLDQLIEDKLIEAEATQLGVEVGEDEVQKQVEALAKQNNMDVAQFREAVQAQGTSWETVRDSLRKQALQFRLLQLKVKPRKVSDEELQTAYAALNANPEMEVRARHIFLALPKDAPAAQRERVKARIDEALRRLKAGEEFAVVMRNLSYEPSSTEGGDLGYFRRGTLFSEADQATFSLAKGALSPLLHTPTGYHLFKVEDRRPVPARPLGEVAEELRLRLSNDSVVKERENYLRALRKVAQVDIKL